MGDRHARHGADGPALLLERARDRLDLFPCGIDVDRVVVGLAAGAEGGGRGGRITDRMGPVAITADQIRGLGDRVPRRCASHRDVVATSLVAAGVLEGLGVDVDLRAVVGGARAAEPEGGRGTDVILEGEPRATAGIVGHVPRQGDRGGARRRPVEPIEDHEDDSPLAGGGRCHLEGMDVGLVEVVGSRVERVLGEPAVDRPEPILAAVGTLLPGYPIQADAKGVDGNEPVGVVRPGDVVPRLIPPMPPRSGAGMGGIPLEPGEAIGGAQRHRRDGHRRRWLGSGGGEPAGNAAEHDHEKNTAAESHGYVPGAGVAWCRDTNTEKS